MSAIMRTVIIHGKKIGPVSPRAAHPHAELWGVTRANARFWGGALRDWTQWYDVHPLTQTGRFAGIPQRRPDGWKWMLEQDGTRPIYLQAPEEHPIAGQEEAARLFAQIPGAKRFPIREIQKYFPVNGLPNRWFVEQTGMMLAKAVMEGFEKIILNGIGTMLNRADFEIAHKTILYWMAFARGRGVDVEVEGPSIFHMPHQIYAYERFNYDELDNARREANGLSLDELTSIEEANERQRRRGRPPLRRYA